jgi:anti-anti-sigma regulatory factor
VRRPHTRDFAVADIVAPALHSASSPDRGEVRGEDREAMVKATEIDLRKALKFQPEQGTVLLGKDRMLILRQEALGVLRQLLGDQVGSALSRAILTQFGARCGSEDHKNIKAAYQWSSEMEEMTAGPVLHTWEGIVKATPTHLEFDRAKGHFLMKGTWENSYEADNYLKQHGTSHEPVCHTLIGYASGWSTSFFGQPLLAVELRCRACGEDVCEFEIRPSDAWGPEADSYRDAMAGTQVSLTRELEDKLQTIERQAIAIRELSTPVLEIWDDVLALPVVGLVDTKRSLDIMSTLMRRIVDTKARHVIVDITGVDMVDTKTADYLLKIVRAANLLGSRCVLTGLSPSVAQTLVEIGADLTEVTTLRDLKAGLRECLIATKQQRSAREQP